MLRIEGRSKPEDVLHELETYNELLPRPGQLACTFLIEIASESERAEKLRAWVGLQEHVFVELDNGERARTEFDPRQVGDGRLSSVQYLRFHCGENVPKALVCDFPGLESRVELSAEQAAALSADLRD